MPKSLSDLAVSVRVLVSSMLLLWVKVSLYSSLESLTSLCGSSSRELKDSELLMLDLA